MRTLFHALHGLGRELLFLFGLSQETHSYILEDPSEATVALAVVVPTAAGHDDSQRVVWAALP